MSEEATCTFVPDPVFSTREDIAEVFEEIADAIANDNIDYSCNLLSALDKSGRLRHAYCRVFQETHWSSWITNHPQWDKSRDDLREMRLLLLTLAAAMARTGEFDYLLHPEKHNASA